MLRSSRMGVDDALSLLSTALRGALGAARTGIETTIDSSPTLRRFEERGATERTGTSVRSSDASQAALDNVRAAINRLPAVATTKPACADTRSSGLTSDQEAQLARLRQKLEVSHAAAKPSPSPASVPVVTKEAPAVISTESAIETLAQPVLNAASETDAGECVTQLLEKIAQGDSLAASALIKCAEARPMAFQKRHAVALLQGAQRSTALAAVVETLRATHPRAVMIDKSL